jgi:hypothetical protein
MPQVARSSPVYDVVVIGSGAGGGTVTKVLADLGRFFPCCTSRLAATAQKSWTL